VLEEALTRVVLCQHRNARHSGEASLLASEIESLLQCSDFTIYGCPCFVRPQPFRLISFDMIITMVFDPTAALGLEPPNGRTPIETWAVAPPITVKRRDRLGGLLHEYEREAVTRSSLFTLQDGKHWREAYPRTAITVTIATRTEFSAATSVTLTWTLQAANVSDRRRH
jgi:hypothetical protein